MKVGEAHYRTIWLNPKDDSLVDIIDQRWLPHRFEVRSIGTYGEMAWAIKEMLVRGAGLIGAAAGYGMYLAIKNMEDPSNWEVELQRAADVLTKSRPTAVNLSWAVERQLKQLRNAGSTSERLQIALETATEIADEDADHCRMIGEHGFPLVQQISERKSGEAVNILTHCNAGWLAFVDYGSATSPIYKAFDSGIPIHVWVDETRPRNQGARLTAWEFEQHGVPYTVIPDNTGGHLMQKGLVDLVIVGTDRTTHTGDVANKIGTYLKALAAQDNHIPFYVALPSSTFDWEITDGVKDIPIEQRDGEEVKYIQGLDNEQLTKVLLTPKPSRAANYAFDVTPARLVSGLITERGICSPDPDSITTMFPDKSPHKSKRG